MKIEPSTKLVCVDDKNQRTDKNDAPDGLVVAGRVYCALRLAKSGLGIELVGIRSLSKKTGEETGFRSSRFVTLEYYRQEFGVKAKRPKPAKARP